jgi:hypothetical protein
MGKRLGEDFAKDAIQAAISRIPGPMAEFLATYFSPPWCKKNYDFVKALSPLTALLVNIALPNRDLWQYLVQINSDFWPDLEDIIEKRAKLPDDPSQWPNDVRDRSEILEKIVKEAGESGEKIKKWLTSDEPQEFINKFKNIIDKLPQLNPKAAKKRLAAEDFTAILRKAEINLGEVKEQLEAEKLNWPELSSVFAMTTEELETERKRLLEELKK